MSNRQYMVIVGAIIAFLIIIWLAMSISITPVAAQSFNCRSARYADEHAICASRHLSQLDRQLDRAYVRAQRFGNSWRVRNQQSRWLNERRGCGGNRGCLVAMYRQRLSELD
jgi:uncharacterized protein